MQGEQQKIIADKTGVSAQTITKWVNDGGWQEQRAASNITRPELVNKLLLTINKLIEQGCNCGSYKHSRDKICDFNF